MEKEKTFMYIIRATVFFLVYVAVTGCGGGSNTTSGSSEDTTSGSSEDTTSGSSEDTTAPVLTLLGQANVEVALNSEYKDAGATASDDKDGDITDKIIVTNETKVNTKMQGEYVITYNVSDAAGNKASELKRTVKVLHEGIEPVVFKNPWDHGALKVVKDEMMLQHEDGTGFFWMADTAWFLYKKTKDEIDTYINNRADKKFTVIQVVATHHHGSFRTPDYNSESAPVLAFNNYNISTPNETYWKHIDYIIKKAEEKGMYVALLPVWRDAIMKVKRDTVERTFVTEGDAENYGVWIATRYKDHKNIIWVVGGDAPLDQKWAEESKVDMLIPDQIARWNALGEGIKSVVGSNHLRTFHPGPSVKKPFEALGKKDWIDFNMIQSSRFGPKDSIVDIKFALEEALPAVDGESLYEDLAYPEKTVNGQVTRGESTRRTAFQIREDAYSQIFAGAFGNTYGHDAIWRFCATATSDPYSPNGTCKEKASFLMAPNITWQDALDAPGGKQMQYVTELMQSRPIVGRKPDQTLINGKPKAEDSDRIIATLGNGYAMVYTPKGKEINVVMGKVSGSNVKAWWYNTRDGKSELIGEFTNSGKKIFIPQDRNDWVLVLDDTSKGFGTPGK